MQRARVLLHEGRTDEEMLELQARTRASPSAGVPESAPLSSIRAVTSISLRTIAGPRALTS